MKIAIAVNGRPHESGVTTYINTVADVLRSYDCDVRVVTIFGMSKYREVHQSFKNKTDSILKGREGLTRLTYIASKIILSLRLLLEYLRSKYDLIWANDISVVNAVYLWSKLIRIPVTLIVHYPINRDLISQEKVKNDSPTHRYFLEEEKRGYKRADRIISLSHYVEQWIENLQPDHAPIRIMRTPMETNDFIRNESRHNIRGRLGFVEEDFVVMFCGRLVNRKGPEFPIMALSSMEKGKRQGIKLIYVGDGPDKDKLKNLAASSGVSEQVFFKGFVKHQLKTDYFLTADVVLVTSVRHEGFEDNSPNVLFEAMAAKVPLIAFKSGGIAELIEHKNTGLVIEERNVAALANALIELKTNRRLCRTIAKNAFQRLQDVHSSQIIGRQILDYFTDLI